MLYVHVLTTVILFLQLFVKIIDINVVFNVFVIELVTYFVLLFVVDDFGWIFVKFIYVSYVVFHIFTF